MRRLIYILLFLPFILFSQTTMQDQVLFTQAQTDIMVSRLNSGFSAPGTSGEDITMMVNESAQFLASPTVGRLDWMPTTAAAINSCFADCNPVPFPRAKWVDDNIFYAGLYAHILANRNTGGDMAYAVQLANAIATQTLARTTEPGLDFGNAAIWVPDNIAVVSPYYLTMLWVEKTMNNWSLIKDLQTNLTNGQETQIDAWFADAASYLQGRCEAYFYKPWGVNWDTSGPISTAYNYTWKTVFAIGGVLQTANYLMNFAAHTTWANIPSNHFGALHTYALLYQDQTALDLAQTWYEGYFQNHVFPDGTSYELERGNASNTAIGINYWGVTVANLTRMAHKHAVAVLNGNPIVSGDSYSQYYDYTTSLGLSDWLSSHTGSDTKGGVKGLENYMIAMGKYIGQTDNSLNLWGSYRQINESPYTTINSTNVSTYCIPMGSANAYYQNTTIESIYDGTGGYRTPTTVSVNGPWSKSYMGPFGVYFIGFPYLQNEGAIYGTTTVNVTGATTYPTTDKMLVAGTRQLTEVVVPSNSTDKTGSWSTSNGAVATVVDGLVTAQGVGTCNITFTTTDGSFVGTTSITVESSSTEDSILILDAIGYYDGTSGDTDSWDDISGYDLHGVENGTITFTDQATFNGSSWYSISDPNNFMNYLPGTDSFTLIWREGDTSPTTSGYAISKADVTPRQYGAAYSAGNFQSLWLGTTVEQSPDSPAPANNRLFVAVIEPTQYNVWADGVPVITNSTAIGTDTSTSNINIGGRSDGGYLMNNGATLDLIATIPKAISTAERQAIETEFQVNGAGPADASIKATGNGSGAPYFYPDGTTKKRIN